MKEVFCKDIDFTNERYVSSYGDPHINKISAMADINSLIIHHYESYDTFTFYPSKLRVGVVFLVMFNNGHHLLDKK